MLHIKKIEDGAEIFKALGSDLRIQIIRLLLENREMNLNEIAASLGITNGALTSHMKKLEESGLIAVLSEHEGHGNQKVCRVNTDRILIDIKPQTPEESKNMYSIDIPVGQYTDYQVQPTCGIATASHLIGEVDDPRYFAHPDRSNAHILWFGKGYVEYLIPNLIPPSSQVDQLILSMELSSEAPGVNNDWPSDISFLINDIPVGTWTSPGDFGDVRGVFTPSWWFPYWNQYGLLKTLILNKNGTFIDGRKLSDVTIQDFRLDYKSSIRLKLMADKTASNTGGLTLFGRSFGNYDQDIRALVSYSPDPH